MSCSGNLYSPRNANSFPQNTLSFTQILMTSTLVMTKFQLPRYIAYNMVIVMLKGLKDCVLMSDCSSSGSTIN